MLEHWADTLDGQREERSRLRGVIVAVLMVLLAAASLAMALRDAVAAPRAESPQECMMLADYALTARALAAARVEERTADQVLGSMYGMTDERGREFARALKRAARDASNRMAPMDFARAIGETCMRSAGDLSAWFGKDA